MDWIISNILTFTFKFLGFTIDIGNFAQTIFDVCNWNKIQEIPLWDIAQSINTIIVPTGLSILTLFIMIDFIKEAMDVERFTWEKAMMILIKFIIIKFLIQNSFYFMSSIMGIMQSVFDVVLPQLQNSASLDLSDALHSINDDVSGWENMIITIFMFLILIPYIGTIIGILVQVFIRIIKIVVGFCCAPIPIALGASDEHRSSCKAFFLWIAALGLEGIIIIIGANLYTTAIGSIEATEISFMLAIMLANGLFMAFVSMASSLAEKLALGH